MQSWLRPLCILVAFLSLTVFADAEAPSAQVKKILLIDSHSAGDSWTEDLRHGILDCLREKSVHGNYETHALGVYFSPGQVPAQSALQELKRRLETNHYDLIIVSNNAATDLFINGTLSAEDTPILVSSYHGTLRTNSLNMTGIETPSTFLPGVKMGLKLRPESKLVVLISGADADGVAQSAAAEKHIRELEDAPVLRLLSGKEYSTRELISELQKLPEESFVIFFSWSSSREEYPEHNNFTILPEIRKQIPHMVLGKYDQHLAQGVDGGVFVSGAEQGRLAGEMAYRILQGERASAIPVRTGEARPMIQYDALDKYDVSPDEFPDDVRILNQPPGWWSVNRYWIGVLAALVALFGSWLFFLYYERRKSFRSQAIYDAMPLRILVADRKGRVYFFQVERNSMGILPRSPAAVKDISPFLHELFNDVWKEILQTGHEVSREYDFLGSRRKGSFTRLPRSIFGVETILWISIDVSELTMSREKLAEAAEHFRITLESIGDGVIVTDTSQKITMCNTVASSYIGYSHEEAVGRPLKEVFNIISYLDDSVVPSPVEKALETNSVVQLANHTDLIAKDGTRRHIADSAAPIHRKNGEVTGAVLVFRDVTAEYQRRDQLRMNHELLQNAAELAHVDYFYHDLKHGNTLVPCRKYWPLNDKKGLASARGWIIDEDVDRFETEWRKLLCGDIQSLQAAYRTRENGKIRYYVMRARRRVSDGISSHALELFGIIQDVTGYQDIVHSYEDANTLLNTILENFPNPVLLKDPENEFKYVLANRGFCSLLGKNSEEVLGKTDFDLFPRSEDAERFHFNDKETMKSSGVQYFEDHFLDPEGTFRDLLMSKISIRRSDGSRLLVAIGTDVTELKNVQREREKVIGDLTSYIECERSLNLCLQNITLQPDFEQSIQFLLREIGETAGADRCYVFLLSEDGMSVSNTHEWVAPGIMPQIDSLQNLKVTDFAGYHERLLRKEYLAFDDLDLPQPEDLQSSVEFLKQQQIRSALLVGIWDKENICGLIGIDFVRKKRSFKECDIHILKNAASLFLLARERNSQMNALADSVSLQRQVFDSISIPILLLDKDFNVVKSNSALETFSEKYGSGLHGGKCYQQYCSCQDQPGNCPGHLAYSTGKPYTVERKIKDRRILISAQPIFDRGGNIIYVLESGFDITDLRMQQEKLRKHNEQMNAYLQQDVTVNACLEMLALNSDFHFVLNEILRRIGQQLQAGSCEVFRHDPEKALLLPEGYWSPQENGDNGSCSRLEAFSERDYPEIFRKLKNREMTTIHLNEEGNKDPELNKIRTYLEQRGMQSICCVSIGFRGNFWGYIEVEFNMSGKSFDEAEVRLIFAAVRIIEILLERESERIKLTRSENEKNMIWELMTVPLVLFSADRRPMRVNPAAERLTGLSASRILEQPCSKSFCMGNIPEDKCPLSLTLREKKPQQTECRIHGRDFQVMTLPVFEGREVVVSVLQIYIDITENNENKRKLLRAIEAAQAADRAKSNFLATMSHEIRTPLNAVIGFSELLQNGDISEKEHVEYLQAINFAGNTLLQLINDILDLSKLDAGRMNIVAQKDDLKKLCEELLLMFSLRAKEKGIDMRLSCPESLPLLYICVQRLRQVLLNLVGNAVKFTPFGRITITVTFEKEDESFGLLKIEIRDTGVGISNEHKGRIFESFFQEDTVRGAHEGTGLGLAISKRLVEHMGGSLGFESELGTGTCFTITLRRIRFEARELPGLPGAPAGSAGENMSAGNPERRKILLVDDVAMNLRVLTAMLRQCNTDVVTASSGPQALEVLKSFRPDLILTDMWMPEMNGSELASKVRAIPPFADTMIVAVTADTETDGNFSMDPFNAILLKPVSMGKLDNLFQLIDRGELDACNHVTL